MSYKLNESHLKNEIIDLIATKREGDYWDFKKEYSDDKTSLILDIICMANSMHPGNKYIIIGVDESDDYKVVGCKKGKNQNEIIHLLRDTSFVGHNRPSVGLYKIQINGKIIDVIVIFDNALKPYYLSEHRDFKREKYILLLMSALPSDKIPEKRKIYLEVHGKQLKYVVKTTNGQVVDGLLDIEVKEMLTGDILLQLRSKILVETSRRGHTQSESEIEVKSIKANYIYTRIGDTNTPVDKNADFYYIEKMWRQRFGIDMTVLDRFRLYLIERTKWSHNPIDNPRDQERASLAHHEFPVYHQVFAEFQIELSEPMPIEEPFCYFYANKSAFFGKASFKYHSTIAFTLDYIYCDEMRELIPYPEVRSIFDGFIFYFFILNNDRGIFYRFLRPSLRLDHRGLDNIPIIIFQDEEELNLFITDATKNKDFILAIKDYETNAIIAQLIEHHPDKLRCIFIAKLLYFYKNYFLTKKPCVLSVHEEPSLEE